MRRGKQIRCMRSIGFFKWLYQEGKRKRMREGERREGKGERRGSYFSLYPGLTIADYRYLDVSGMYVRL